MHSLILICFYIPLLQNIFKLQLPADAPTPQLQPHSNVNLITMQLTKSEVLQAVQDEDNIWRLFPQRKFVFSLDPHQILPSNLERIYKDSCLWVATKDVTESNSSLCKSISSGRTHYINHGTRYDLDFYGNDPDDLYNHLVLHLSHGLRCSVHDGVHLYLFVDRSIDEDIIASMMDKIHGLRFSDDSFIIYIQERPFVGRDPSKAKL